MRFNYLCVFILSLGVIASLVIPCGVRFKKCQNPTRFARAFFHSVPYGFLGNPAGLNEKKQPNKIWLLLNFLAEREGFEPPEPLGSTVFKTAAIDHSAISPRAKVYLIFYSDNILCEVFLST